MSKAPPMHGPYGELYRVGGQLKRRLTSQGRVEVEKFLVRYPKPITLYRRVFPGQFWRATQMGVPVEDIEAACLEGVVETVIRFDPKRCKDISTAAAWGCRSTVTRLIADRHKTRKEFIASDYTEQVRGGRDVLHPYYDTPQPDDPAADRDEERDRLEVARLLDAASIDDKRIHVLNHVYGLAGCAATTLKQTGRTLGVLKQLVQQLRDDALDELRYAAGAEHRNGQARDRIVRVLRESPRRNTELRVRCGLGCSQFQRTLAAMCEDGTVEAVRTPSRTKPGKLYRLANTVAA